MPNNTKTIEDNRLQLLFLLYGIGRKIKSLSKNGNNDQALQTIILRSLVDKPIDVTELSKIICANMSSVSESIDKLEKSGLIEKFPCCDDKRKYYIKLTEKGTIALRDTQEVMRLHCVKSLNNLADKEIKSLLTMLKKVEL
jgi:DNA-binding MarR family transcriptional regulator